MWSILLVITVFLYVICLVQGITNVGSTVNPLSVQNPISGPKKDDKVQEKRFSDFKSPYLKGTLLDRDRDRDRYGLSRPPDPIEHRYGVDSGASGSGGGNSGFITTYGGHESSRYPVTSYGTGSRDRISVPGHYGSTGYSDDGYDRRPYGPPQVVDINDYSHSYNPHGVQDNGLHWDQKGYGYPEPSPAQHWMKSAILPIAGAALLGLAAVLVANPVLLQLGVLSGVRRKRDISTKYNVDHSQDIAYRGYSRVR